jgi:glycosyltransferase involved in cell wall biosynthesis
VLASDLPPLREAGGAAAVYRPVGDLPAWTEAVLALLDDHQRRTIAWHARRAAGLAHARRFHWSHHVRRLLEIYHSVLVKT